MRSGICLDGRIASLTTGDHQPLAPTPANQPTNPPILHPSAQHGCVTQRRFLPTRAPSASSHLRDQDPSKTHPALWCRYSYLAEPGWTNTSTVASCRGTASPARIGPAFNRSIGAPATPATPVSDTLGKRRTAAALPAGRCVGCPPPGRLALVFRGREARRHGKDHPMNTSKRLQRVERSMRLRPTASRRPPPSSRCATVQHSPRRPRRGTAPTARDVEVDRGRCRHCSIVGPS